MPIPSPSQAHEVPRIRACEPKIAASSFSNLQQEGFQVEFEGLKAVVTGDASGIGASVTESLVRRGAKVAVLDLMPERVSGDALAIKCDVSDDASVRSAVDQAVASLSGLDVLVNNAGIGAQGTVEDNDDDEWHTVLDLNLLGVVRVSRAALTHLRRSEYAAIVNTCSVAAMVSLPNRALYSATKGAVLSLTLAMAADHLCDGIRVNCVSPGTADTPWIDRLLARTPDPTAERAALMARQPTGRLVAPGEVAAAIVYLASPLAGSSTGVNLTVDGGILGLRLRSSES